MNKLQILILTSLAALGGDEAEKFEILIALDAAAKLHPDEAENIGHLVSQILGPLENPAQDNTLETLKAVAGKFTNLKETCEAISKEVKIDLAQLKKRAELAGS